MNRHTDLPTDIAQAHTPRFDQIGQGEAVQHLIGMIEILRAQNEALMAEIARMVIGDRPGAVTVRIEPDRGAPMCLLVWRDGQTQDGEPQLRRVML